MAWLSRVVTSVRPAAARLRARLSPLTDRINPRYVTAGAAFLLAAIVGDVVIGSPGAREIRTLSHMPVATVVLDRYDKPAFTIFEERRYEISLAEIAPSLVQAVVAIEDQRFFTHHGVDVWRIAGSAWANVRSTSLDQGGSTITQQLAKLSFLKPDKTLRRKLKEAYLAVRIEQEYSKNEILEIYLNKVYFGSGLYGAEAAARGYFGKHAADVTMAEAALLAGLIQRPSAYAPDQHLDRAIARRAIVLDQMADARMLDRETARSLARTPVTLANGFEHERSGAYFNQTVTRELVERFGLERVTRGGLRVYTTYDAAAQRAAEKSLEDGLLAIERRKAFKYPARGRVSPEDDGQSPDYLQGALVAIDPASGEIRALVGGRDFRESPFDRVTQARRQSGSAFKPFVYATALEQGYSPATLITDLDKPIPTPEGLWLPDDGHGELPEAMTIRTALRISSNRAAAQVLQRIGVTAAADAAKRMGVETPAVPSLVLGTGDVSLLSLTLAYAVFANGGALERPMMIRRVEDADGTVLLRETPESHRVISTQTAFQISAMLADVVDRGTAWQARQAGFRLPAAGKTGTTNDYRDAWFIGYTPDLVAGVWVGFDRPRTIVPGGYAADLAVPIWGAFMREATTGEKGRPFPRPPGLVAVEICQDSGLLPAPACSRVRRVSTTGESREVSAIGVEYFRPGTEPKEYCPIHQDTWFHGVKTASFNPSDLPASALLRPPPALVSRQSLDKEGSAVAANTDPPKAQPDKPRANKGFWGKFLGAFKGEKPKR